MKLTIPSDIVVGQYLQLIVLTITAALAATYALGYVLGQRIHLLNNNITDFMRPIVISYMHMFRSDSHSTRAIV